MLAAARKPAGPAKPGQQADAHRGRPGLFGHAAHRQLSGPVLVERAQASSDEPFS
jgi:hypothetical protein